MNQSAQTHLRTLICVAAVGFGRVPCEAQTTTLAQAPRPIDIIIFGQNSPTWNRQMGVAGTRTSCSDSPTGCLTALQQLLTGQGTHRAYLNLPIALKTAISSAQSYSELASTFPALVELSIDDFGDTFRNWCAAPNADCTDELAKIITTMKSQTSNLGFGITVYEDQLESAVQNPRLPPSLRELVDTIHLAIHYRGNGPQYAYYVTTVKNAFPRARIMAVSYAYDRIDYVPCSANSTVMCSLNEELHLFQQTLQTQLDLLSHHAIDGLEFYPGYFGIESLWPGWRNPRICKPERVDGCISNTTLMHKMATEQMQRYRSQSTRKP